MGWHILLTGPIYTMEVNTVSSRVSKNSFIFLLFLMMLTTTRWKVVVQNFSPTDWGLVRGLGGEVQINNNCVVDGMDESEMTLYTVRRRHFECLLLCVLWRLSPGLSDCQTRTVWWSGSPHFPHCLHLAVQVISPCGHFSLDWQR